MFKKNIAFNQHYFERICSYTLKGMTLKAMSHETEMPQVKTLYYWTKRYPCLKHGIGISKKFRNEYAADSLLDTLLSQLT